MRYRTLADVPEKDIARALLYMDAAVRLGVSRTATRIAQYVVNNCLLCGECVTSHTDFQRRTGVGRRSVDRSLRSLLASQLIERTGRSSTGQYVYRAVLERGDEYAAWGKEFDQRWRDARKANRLGSFTAPTYRSAGEDHAQV